MTDVSAQERVQEIVRLAGRAPSIHNTQPWRWEQSGADLRLYADLSRRLPATDPQGRDLLISCGAALHHLQVAAAGLGWSARVTRLPVRRADLLLAVVHLRPGHRGTPEAEARLEALLARRTDRRPMSPAPVTPERLNRLCATGTSWGAQVLPVLSERHRATLEMLGRRASAVQNSDRRYSDELAAWTGRGEGGGGIPSAHLPTDEGPRSTAGVPTLQRTFPEGTLTDGQVAEQPGEGALMLVCTRYDDDIARLRAGEAMSAVWLHAVADGLMVVPLTQALEVEETRFELQTVVLRDLAVPQILLRVGWVPAYRDPLPATPRLALDDVLTVSCPLEV